MVIAIASLPTIVRNRSSLPLLVATQTLVEEEVVEFNRNYDARRDRRRTGVPFGIRQERRRCEIVGSREALAASQRNQCGYDIAMSRESSCNRRRDERPRSNRSTTPRSSASRCNVQTFVAVQPYSLWPAAPAELNNSARRTNRESEGPCRFASAS